MNVPALETLLAAFPVVARIVVAWSDMDALGHVNNAMYFRYFEAARIAYLERLDAMALLGATGVGPILAATHCHFRAPLTYPDTIAVGARTTGVGEDRITMEYAVVSPRLGRVAAEGGAVVVTYDYQQNRKAPLPEALRARIAALEGAPAGLTP
ncbi:MAG: thioesterase [Chromatiales bacterium 21-64-14]|nr:MAG: thioesterase [Chromatiales bacterium 21-64-14]HQU16151.1 thioesterase family protein [Gammaproteobacteria bacterium]